MLHAILQRVWLVRVGTSTCGTSHDIFADHGLGTDKAVSADIGANYVDRQRSK